MAPAVGATMLYQSLQHLGQIPPGNPLPSGWLIELPETLSHSHSRYTSLGALVSSRRNLVQLLSLCSWILLVHLAASNRAQKEALSADRKSVV